MNDQLETAVIEAIRRLQDKVSDNHDAVQKELKEVNVSLVKQEENLRQHMYRTELAEKRLEHIEEDLKPIKSVLAGAKGVFAVIGAIATLAGMVLAIFEIVTKLL